MNKIETGMVAAIRDKQLWTQTNTTVWHDNTGAALVTIYGHPIARQMADGSWLFTIVSDHLALSRSRINAIARANRIACVFAHKGRTMFFIPGKALSEAPLDYWFALPTEIIPGDITPRASTLLGIKREVV